MMFFGSIRKAVREKRQALADRDLALTRLAKAEAEVERLREKLEKRSDFYIDREMRIFDRFFTSQIKTFAITDEIKSKQYDEDHQEDPNAALDAYLDDKKQFLITCAREAGLSDPEDQAHRTFEANRSQYVLEYQQNFR